jgi:hypothetical protein
MHKHKDLCTLAVKWLKRPNCQNGHGCIVAVSEPRSGYSGEIPDAIGFRIDGDAVTSVVLEAKVSRADFLADRNKAHRIEGGLGHYRYYICPENIIQEEDLPEGWGLIWVNKRGHVKLKAGAALAFSQGYDQQKASLHVWRQETDYAREQWLLVRLLSRVGDAEQVNEWIKEANRMRVYWEKEAHRLRDEMKQLKSERNQLRREHQVAMRRMPRSEAAEPQHTSVTLTNNRV